MIRDVKACNNPSNVSTRNDVARIIQTFVVSPIPSPYFWTAATPDVSTILLRSKFDGTRFRCFDIVTSVCNLFVEWSLSEMNTKSRPFHNWQFPSCRHHLVKSSLLDLIFHTAHFHHLRERMCCPTSNLSQQHAK
jgi:hypothetical protein